MNNLRPLSLFLSAIGLPAPLALAVALPHLAADVCDGWLNPACVGSASEHTITSGTKSEASGLALRRNDSPEAFKRYSSSSDPWSSCSSARS